MKRMQSAPWKPLFQTHVSKITPPTFTLATLSTAPPTSTTNPGFPSPSSSSSSTDAPSTPTFTPRCRTMIFRGFLASLPPNPHNPLPAHNPRIYTSDALTFTTDSRMAKTGDLRVPPASSSGGGGGNAAVLSTGGAYVEALFWIAGDTATGENIQNQWRVRGRCYLLAEADADEATAVTDVLRQCLVPTAGDGEAAAAAWSWRREVQAHFANLAPALRGSFANPPPGSAVGVPLAGWDAGRAGGAAGELVKGGKVPDGCVLDAEGHAARARANMRLGVIVPEVVERLDLAEDEGRARRWVYSKVGGEDGGDVVAGWKVEETWP
ncbi:pyridoxamine 5'-phosphate oxidase-domain-containing protein [Morchella snyderi]|nr:pyridoxamine 5'-phosphate oxidase-domain-containing protein [Morchella snyderi]